MPGITDQARIKAFREQLVAELYKIPTPTETQQFLTGSLEARQKLTRSCKQRAQPLIQMLMTLDIYSTID